MVLFFYFFKWYLTNCTFGDTAILKVCSDKERDLILDEVKYCVHPVKDSHEFAKPEMTT